jgi:HEAT repeat protein
MRFLLGLVLLSSVVLSAAGAEDDFGQRLATALDHLPGAPALQALQALVDQGTDEQRQKALVEIQTRGSVAARPVVLHLAQQGGPVIAARALDTLCRMGAGSVADAEAVDALLGHADERVRRSTITCLAAWRDITQVPALVAKLTGDTQTVHDEALAALGTITGQTLGPDPKAWTDWYTARMAVTAPKFEQLTNQLHDSDGAKVAAAVAELAGISDRRTAVIDLLKPLVQDDDVRVAAAAYSALKAIAPLEMVGVEPVTGPATRTPTAAKAPQKQAAQSTSGSAWSVILIAAVLLGIGWWLVRRMTAGTQMLSVDEVVRRSQREAGIDSEHDVPAVRAPVYRPASTKAPAAPAAPAATAKPGAKPAPKPGQSDVTVGKRGEKIFKLD